MPKMRGWEEGGEVGGPSLLARQYNGYTNKGNNLRQYNCYANKETISGCSLLRIYRDKFSFGEKCGTPHSSVDFLRRRRLAE
jgi:hypothetical protein